MQLPPSQLSCVHCSLGLLPVSLMLAAVDKPDGGVDKRRRGRRRWKADAHYLQLDCFLLKDVSNEGLKHHTIWPSSLFPSSLDY